MRLAAGPAKASVASSFNKSLSVAGGNTWLPSAIFYLEQRVFGLPKPSTKFE
jgi:hypothetical protein